MAWAVSKTPNFPLKPRAQIPSTPVPPPKVHYEVTEPLSAAIQALDGLRRVLPEPGRPIGHHR